jgi:hypothetical protein
MRNIKAIMLIVIALAAGSAHAETVQTAAAVKVVPVFAITRADVGPEGVTLALESSPSAPLQLFLEFHAADGSLIARSRRDDFSLDVAGQTSTTLPLTDPARDPVPAVNLVLIRE